MAKKKRKNGFEAEENTQTILYNNGITILLRRTIMKKILAFATTIAMLLSLAVLGSSASSEVWDGSVATSFESGNGTEADPYVIKNGAQLAYLAQQVATKADTYAGKYIVLGSNIDLAKLEWTPIGVFKSKNSESNVAFEGSFDGVGLGIGAIQNGIILKIFTLGA